MFSESPETEMCPFLASTQNPPADISPLPTPRLFPDNYRGGGSHPAHLSATVSPEGRVRPHRPCGRERLRRAVAPPLPGRGGRCHPAPRPQHGPSPGRAGGTMPPPSIFFGKCLETARLGGGGFPRGAAQSGWVTGWAEEVLGVLKRSLGVR